MTDIKEFQRSRREKYLSENADIPLETIENAINDSDLKADADSVKRQKQREYLQKYRKEHAEELRQKRREYKARKRQEKIAAGEITPRKQKSNATSKPKPKKKAQIPESGWENEPSTYAALVNQSNGFSVIVGEYHSKSGQNHVIVERFNGIDPSQRYRIKFTSYTFAPSMNAVRGWAKRHKIQLKLH